MKRMILALQLVLVVPAVAMAEGAFCGKYRGLVASAVDPTMAGRVQVTVPAVLGDVAVWALPDVSFGRVALPATGATVWISFEACDPNLPVWEGALTVTCKPDKNGIPRHCRTQ